MAASVRIEDEAFVDPRIELLATLAGFNRYEALGRMAHVWRVCTQRETYVLPELIVAACLGENGPDLIVKVGLGERVSEGIRVRGTEGRIEWLKVRREAAKRGGQASAKQRASKGNQVPSKRQPKAKQASTTGQANVEQNPAKRQPNTNPPTASLSLTTSLNPEDKEPPTPAKPGVTDSPPYPAVAATGKENDPGREQSAAPGGKFLPPPETGFDPTAPTALTEIEPFEDLIAAWVAAQLPGYDSPGGIQKTGTRVGHWQNRQRDPTWQTRWRMALARAGKSTRCKGGDAKWPQGLRLETFVRDPDVLVRILEGEFDDAAVTLPFAPIAKAGGKPTATDVVDAALAKIKSQGAAS